MCSRSTTRRRGMSFFVRDKHSCDFSLTRIFMTLFRTASAVVVTECQKLFCFLPLRYQVNVRTPNFMLRFIDITLMLELISLNGYMMGSPGLESPTLLCAPPVPSSN